MLPKQWNIPTIWKVLGTLADLDEFGPKRMEFLAHKPVMEKFLNLKKFPICKILPIFIPMNTL